MADSLILWWIQMYAVSPLMYADSLKLPTNEIQEYDVKKLDSAFASRALCRKKWETLPYESGVSLSLFSMCMLP